MCMWMYWFTQTLAVCMRRNNHAFFMCTKCYCLIFHKTFILIHQTTIVLRLVFKSDKPQFKRFMVIWVYDIHNTQQLRAYTLDIQRQHTIIFATQKKPSTQHSTAPYSTVHPSMCYVCCGSSFRSVCCAIIPFSFPYVACISFIYVVTSTIINTVRVQVSDSIHSVQNNKRVEREREREKHTQYLVFAVVQQ